MWNYVVICFHSLIYWYLIQPALFGSTTATCCDLLSFFDLLIFDTTVIRELTARILLWFAFILWSTDIWYNLLRISPTIALLWFAFILWSTDIWYNCCLERLEVYYVVICFHSLIYWYLIQHIWHFANGSGSCDLLSFFDLLIFDTTRLLWSEPVDPLWFAFILWSTDIWYNRCFSSSNFFGVVICFHSLIYWYLIQPFTSSPADTNCCDLLSFFDLLIFDTTLQLHGAIILWLWFAFILWSTDIWYNLQTHFSFNIKGLRPQIGSKNQ